MELDLMRLATVASLALVGCRPTFSPEPVGVEPTPAVIAHRPAAPGGHSALVAEMCLGAVDGRPAVAPLAMRTVSWTTDRDELEDVLVRGRAALFAVIGFDGHVAGRFTALGPGDGPVLDGVGSYTGANPCAPGGTLDGAVDAACAKVRHGCGLAVATVGEAGGQFDGEAAPPPVIAGGACRSGAVLAIDVDGDGTAEAFPLADFLDPVQAPAGEVTATVAAAPACTPTFSLLGQVVPGGPQRVELDVLGVVDLDGDGAREVIVGLRYPESRTVAVYSAIDAAVRLSLVGEVVPWAR
ncbi:MAG: hypothetical protein R3B06_05800 [Kofleriaceae bacterium]